MNTTSANARVILSDEAIAVLQEGVTEPFPAQHTVAECKAWMLRNEAAIYWLSIGLLEDAIKDAETAADVGMLVTGPDRLQ